MLFVARLNPFRFAPFFVALRTLSLSKHLCNVVRCMSLLHCVGLHRRYLSPTSKPVSCFVRVPRASRRTVFPRQLSPLHGSFHRTTDAVLFQAGFSASLPCIARPWWCCARARARARCHHVGWVDLPWDEPEAGFTFQLQVSKVAWRRWRGRRWRCERRRRRVGRGACDAPRQGRSCRKATWTEPRRRKDDVDAQACSSIPRRCLAKGASERWERKRDVSWTSCRLQACLRGRCSRWCRQTPSTIRRTREKTPTAET